MKQKVDVAIIGAGTAGLAALSQVRRETDNYVLINGGELGTTCARVGCMPSKAVIQVADDFHRRHTFDRVGIAGEDQLSIEIPEAMEHVRDLRDIFVDRVLAGTTDDMGEQVFVDGYARFVGPNLLDVDGRQIRADRIIIATGSRPIVPSEWAPFSDRVLTTDNFFEQSDLPKTIAVVGLGVIGLELGQALARVGIGVTGVDLLDTVGGITDPVVNRLALELFNKEFPMWLGEPAQVQQQGNKLLVQSGEHGVRVDKILACIGRRPNLEQLGLEHLGVDVDERGIPKHDPHTMQIDDLPIFIAGDVNAERPILHEAADEGRIAGRNAVSDRIYRYKRRTPLMISFTDPNIASVGTSFLELDRDQVVTGEIRFGPVGRALLMGKNKGMLRVYARQRDGKLIGASMVAPGGEHLAHLLAWSIQQNQTVFDLLKMPYYHPAIEEGLQSALQDLRRQVGEQPDTGFDLDRLDT